MLKTDRKLRPLSSLVVFATLLALMFVGYGLSISLGNFAALHWVVAVGVFFFVLFQPAAIPMTSTMVLGLFIDGLESTPFGFYALGLLALHQLAFYQRRFLLRRPFNVIWTGFVMDTLVMALLLSVIMWMRDVMPDMRLLVSLGVLWALFPVFYVVMNGLYEHLIEER